MNHMNLFILTNNLFRSLYTILNDLVYIKSWNLIYNRNTLLVSLLFKSW